MDEVGLWDHYLQALMEQEDIGYGPNKAGLIVAEAVKLARDGLNSENRTFCLNNPPNSQQRRLISWGIIVCDGRVCHFHHEKFQDFLYAWDATQRNAMPSIVLEEIDEYKTRNVLLWMEKIYERRYPQLHKQFLKEVLRV
jgi:hypothetical protein